MNDFFLPRPFSCRRYQCINRSQIVRSTVKRRANQNSLSVHRETALWNFSVGLSMEKMQNRLRPLTSTGSRRGKFENRSVGALKAAHASVAIRISCLVEDDSSSWSHAVGRGCAKIMKSG